MKYLKIYEEYEAFDSAALSKVVNFLNKKLGKTNCDKFMNDLKGILYAIDTPISKISNDEIKYLRSKTAIPLKPKENSSNRFGIDCLKFWFTLDDGYLGYTGIGNKRIKYNKDGKVIIKPFDESQLDYIKNDLGIRTGKIEPADYKNLKTGDEVIFILARLYPTHGTIWIKDNKIWVIQNVKAGSTPSGSEWEKYGKWGWCIVSSDGNIESDHSKLHRYYPGEEELTYKESEEVENPMDYNLPVEGMNLSPWTSKNMINLNHTDFAIVLHFDDLVKKNHEPITKIKSRRKEAKKGATKFMSNEDIKKLNINRYLDLLVETMGINEKEVEELRKLERFITLITDKKYALFSIYNNSGDVDNITRITTHLKELIRGNNKKDNVIRLKTLYNNLSLRSSGVRKHYQKLLDAVNASNNEEAKEQFKILKECSDKIYNSIKKSDLKTIEDLKVYWYIIKNLHTVMRDEEISFSVGADGLGPIIRSYTSNYNDILNYINRTKFTSKNKVINIKKYVDENFR